MKLCKKKLSPRSPYYYKNSKIPHRTPFLIKGEKCRRSDCTQVFEVAPVERELASNTLSNTKNLREQQQPKQQGIIFDSPFLSILWKVRRYELSSIPVGCSYRILIVLSSLLYKSNNIRARTSCFNCEMPKRPHQDGGGKANKAARSDDSGVRSQKVGRYFLHTPHPSFNCPSSLLLVHSVLARVGV